MIGVLVDTLDRILTVDESKIQSAEGISRADRHKMVAGIPNVDEEIYTVLNPKFILENEETASLADSLKQ